MGFSPRFTISSTLMLVFTLFCISVIICISYISYSDTSKNIINSFNREELASEELFTKSSIYIHRGLKLWDSSYDKKLFWDMDYLIDAYDKSDGNPGKINLTNLQLTLDPVYKEQMHFYFINRSGIIEYTTDSREYLLNLSLWPEFKEKIDTMIESDEYIPDEIVKGFLPDAPLRKFVYHSTSDHRYLAQIGLIVQNDSVKERAELSYGNLVKYVLDANPKLINMHVISTMGTLIIGNKDYPGRKLDRDTKKITELVFRTHERIVVRNPENMTETVYIFVPNTVENTPSAGYMNLVGKFIYSTKELYNQLNFNLLLHFLIIIIASLFSVLTVILITRRLTGPINTLVTEIDQIAKGNLNQKISETWHPELKRIADAVRTMVSQITGTILKLQTSEAQYRNLFNTASDGIFIVHNDLIVDANPVAVKLFPDKIIDPKEITLRELSLQVSEFVRNSQKKGDIEPPASRVSEADIRIEEVNKPARTLNVRTVPLDSGENPLLQVQIRDISNRIRMEERLQDMNINLEEQVKERTASLEATIADLDSFSYTVSHDLRAPLRAIDGNTHILTMKGQDLFTADMTRHMTRIHENIRKMDDLINDLLNFSRISRKKLDLTEIDMNQTIYEIINEINAAECLAHASIHVSSLPLVQGDITLVRQVLENLIHNAIKFGKVGLINEITIYSRLSEGKTWYSIKDTGIGFDMQYADRIFEAFLQLNPDLSMKGTGIGLAIVKRIILRHNGQIQVISQEGIGSEFSFTLE